VWRNPTLLAAFVASASAGLLFLFSWGQYLALFLGSSSSVQWMIFVLVTLGSALGAWLVSRFSEKIRRPLLCFAVIQMAVGLSGLLFDWIYRSAGQWSWWANQRWPESVGSSGLSSWMLAAVLILPQSMLFGAAFSLQSAGWGRLQPRASVRAVASSYVAAGIGAALGAILGANVLLPAMGLPGIVFTAGLLSIGTALAVYLLSEVEKGFVPLIKEPGGLSGKREAAWVLGAAFLTALTSFVHAVSGERILSVAFGGALQTAQLSIAVFASGIALGATWMGRRIERSDSPLRSVCKLQIWLPLGIVASVWFCLALRPCSVGLMQSLTSIHQEGEVLNLPSIAAAILVMLPVAFGVGASVPMLIVALFRIGVGERARALVHAVVGLGASVGGWLAIHVLLPSVGAEFASLIAAAGSWITGAVLLTQIQRREGRAQLTPFLAIYGVGAIALFASASMGAAGFAMTRASSSSEAAAFTAANVIYQRDGKSNSVAVYDHQLGGQSLRSLAVDGDVVSTMSMSPDSRTIAEDDTAALLAVLPLSLRPSYGRVGVMGFGSGVTTHTLLGSQKIGRVDTIEVEPFKVEGARYFEEFNWRAFRDGRSNVIYDDPRAFLAASEFQYDLLIAGPSPWRSEASLFSEEFYASVLRTLRPDGVFVQWMPLHNVKPKLVGSILRAVLSNFHDTHAYLTNAGDLVLVSSPREQMPVLTGYAFEQPSVATELRRFGFEGVRDLQDAFVVSRRGLEIYAVLNPLQTNSDFYPILQSSVPQSNYLRSAVLDFDRLQAAPWSLTRLLGEIQARRPDEPLAAIRRPTTLDAKLHDARAIAITMSSRLGASGPLRGNSLHRIYELRQLMEKCQLGKSDENVIEFLLSRAGDTVPYLDASTNAAIWSQPAWVKCAMSEPAVRDTAAFIAAVGQGDPHRIVETGDMLMTGPAGRVVAAHMPSSYFVWGTLQAALVESGDRETARDIQRRIGPALPEQVREDSVIRWMSAMAALPKEHLIGPAPGG
jgi:spermidine synthase